MAATTVCSRTTTISSRILKNPACASQNMPNEFSEIGEQTCQDKVGPQECNLHQVILGGGRQNNALCYICNLWKGKSEKYNLIEGFILKSLHYKCKNSAKRDHMNCKVINPFELLMFCHVLTRDFTNSFGKTASSQQTEWIVIALVCINGAFTVKSRHAAWSSWRQRGGGRSEETIWCRRFNRPYPWHRALGCAWTPHSWSYSSCRWEPPWRARPPPHL